MARKTKVSDLKPGQRFDEIPPAWHGRSIVRSVHPSGRLVKLEFDNRKIVNPPGIAYMEPDSMVLVRSQDNATAK